MQNNKIMILLICLKLNKKFQAHRITHFFYLFMYHLVGGVYRADGLIGRGILDFVNSRLMIRTLN